MDPALYLHLQSTDSTNFFFFFRMLLVWYKREFEWADVLRLWESLWTDYLSSNFHLFIALAILEKHRDVIMKHLKHFDEVLKYGTSASFPRLVGWWDWRRVWLTGATVNELSNTIDLPSTLLRAQNLFRRFQRTVEAIDKKDNFPAPKVRQRKPVEGRGPSSSGSGVAAIGTGTDVSAGTDDTTGAGETDAQSPGRDGTRQKVITPELRNLLSRKVEKLDKQAVVEHGGGVGTWDLRFWMATGMGMVDSIDLK